MAELCATNTFEQGTPCLVFLWLHRDRVGHQGAVTARTRQGRIPLCESFHECWEGCVRCVQYVRCDLLCEVCSVQCCMWCVLRYVGCGIAWVCCVCCGGCHLDSIKVMSRHRPVIADTSRRLAMGGSRKKQQDSRSSRAQAPLSMSLTWDQVAIAPLPLKG